MVGDQWRGDLRYDREPVRHAGVGPLHRQARKSIRSRLRLAEGRPPGADRSQREARARIRPRRRAGAHRRAGGLRAGGAAPPRATQHDRCGDRTAGWGRFWAPMKAAVLVDVGRIELRDVPCPAPAPREVLVRVTGVGLCGTDFHIFAGHANYNRDGRGRAIPPRNEAQILGHEIAGVVEEAGGAVDDLGVGDRVVVDQGRNCVSEARSPRCEYCASGDSHQCAFYREHGITGLPGGFAEYVTIPAVNAVRTDTSLDDATAALTEPLGCVVHSADVLLRMPGRYALEGGRGGKGGQVSHVLICGAGPAGLLWVQYLRNVLGYDGLLLVSEPAAAKRALAARFGADTIDPGACDPWRSCTSGRTGAGPSCSSRPPARAKRSRPSRGSSGNRAPSCCTDTAIRVWT